MVEEIEIICERENALGGPLIYVDRSLTDYVNRYLISAMLARIYSVGTQRSHPYDQIYVIFCCLIYFHPD